MQKQKSKILDLLFSYRKKVSIRSFCSDKDKMNKKREFLIYKPIDAFVWI